MYEKKCSDCQACKPLKDFGVCKSNRDGHQSKCILCNREKARAYYYAQKQAEVHGGRSIRRKARMKEAISQVKANSGCCFCGEKCSLCLDFHHIHEDAKSFTIGDGCRLSFPLIEEEIKKCEIVCANCHRKIHGGVLQIGCRRDFDISPISSLVLKTRSYSRYKI